MPPLKHIPCNMCSPTRETHIPSDMHSLPGKHILLVIFVAFRRKKIFLVICVPLRGKHIYLVICVPRPGKHISRLVKSVTLPVKHILSDMCSPTWEIHIPCYLCSPTCTTHIHSDMFFPTREIKIPCDMSCPTYRN